LRVEIVSHRYIYIDREREREKYFGDHGADAGTILKII
jgi:hypothetical protein